MAVEVLHSPAMLKSAGATTSLASGTAASCASLTLTPGVWLAVATCRIAADATGQRALKISKAADDFSAASEGFDRRAALSGAQTPLAAVMLLNVASAATYHMVEWQNSGSSLATYGAFRAVRLA